MVPGYVMLMGGSALRWYNQNEKQHKVFGAFGGQLIAASGTNNEYLPAHRCYDCNNVLLTLDAELSSYDQASVDKAR